MKISYNIDNSVICDISVISVSINSRYEKHVCKPLQQFVSVRDIIFFYLSIYVLGVSLLL